MCSCDDEAPLCLSELSLQANELKPCRRCGSKKPYIVLDKVHVECMKCFLESCNKKIRSTIGKSKLLRNNDSILLAFSGSASSSALLDLIKMSMEYDTRREQKFRASILHLDVQSMFGLANVDPVEREEKLSSLLENTRKAYPDWPLYWTSLETSHRVISSDISDEPIWLEYNSVDPKFNTLLAHSNKKAADKKEVAGSSSNSAADAATKAYESFWSASENLDLTDRLQYIRKCTIDLINKVAAEINYGFARPEDQFKYVFTANSATQLANNLLVDVILGQGKAIRSTVNICDNRAKVPIMRPMRDFSKKEIVFYLKARGIEFHAQPDLATLTDSKGSIQKVTEAFLSKLYVDYPSTYSTLLRTGDKMQEQYSTESSSH